jgi:RNA polymerase sigma-70 factor (ECF subfamily)
MKRKATPDFDAVYREHADRVFRYCRTLCRNNDAEAQDVAQETFIRAYRALEKFEGRSSMLTWLLRIARREWIRRNAGADETVELDEAELPDPAGDPSVRETHRIWLQDALARLPEQLREAVVLVKVDGLTHREAAEVLDLPQGTVQFHVSQGLKQLRKLLVEEAGVSGLTALLLVLFLQREMQAAVTAPPALGERIYASIGREYPPAGTAVPGADDASQGANSARWRHRALAATGVLLLLLSGALLWKHAGNQLVRPDPLQSVLKSMSKVKTAHATAVRRSWSRGRGGVPQMRESKSEFWYKMPASYRHRWSGEGRHWYDLVLVGGRAARRADLPNAVQRQLIWGNLPEVELAPFAFFTPDSRIARLSLQAGTTVTELQAEWENRTVRLLTVECQVNQGRNRWQLYVDPESRRVLRAEFSSFDRPDAYQLPPNTITIEHFDYDGAIPDEVFRIEP